MVVNASQLRANIYKLLDQVLETGEEIEIRRKGHRLKIVPVAPPSKLSRLKKHDCINCDPEDLVHIDWSQEWNIDLP